MFPSLRPLKHVANITKVLLIFIRIHIFNFFSQFVVKVAYFVDKIYTSYTTYKIWMFLHVFVITSLRNLFLGICSLLKAFLYDENEVFCLSALYLVLWSVLKDWFKRKLKFCRLLWKSRELKKRSMPLLNEWFPKQKNHALIPLFQLISY